jgi:hypothetical protein
MLQAIIPCMGEPMIFTILHLDEITNPRTLDSITLGLPFGNQGPILIINLWHIALLKLTPTGEVFIIRAIGRIILTVTMDEVNEAFALAGARILHHKDTLTGCTTMIHDGIDVRGVPESEFLTVSHGDIVAIGNYALGDPAHNLYLCLIGDRHDTISFSSSFDDIKIH